MDKEQQFVGIVQECSDFVFPSVLNGVVSTKSCNNCLSSKRGQCENEFKNNLENSK